MFPDGLWLPNSDLQNSGFWRRYGNNSFFPKTTLKPHAVCGSNPTEWRCRRRLSDRDLGASDAASGNGLGSMTKQVGFQPRQTLMSLSISSEVLSLAETDDNVLWIGTAKGLYALEDGYEGPVQRLAHS